MCKVMFDFMISFTPRNWIGNLDTITRAVKFMQHATDMSPDLLITVGHVGTCQARLINYKVIQIQNYKVQVKAGRLYLFLVT